MAGGGHTIALDEANKRIFVGCRTPPMVVVMDMETGKEITSVPIPKDNDDLFFDAKRKRLYASCGEGFIAVIRQLDADHYEVVGENGDGQEREDVAVRRGIGPAVSGGAAARGQAGA